MDLYSEPGYGQAMLSTNPVTRSLAAVLAIAAISLLLLWYGSQIAVSAAQAHGRDKGMTVVTSGSFSPTQGADYRGGDHPRFAPQNTLGAR
jgi:hypothetical protein